MDLFRTSKSILFASSLVTRQNWLLTLGYLMYYKKNPLIVLMIPLNEINTEMSKYIPNEGWGTVSFRDENLKKNIFLQKMMFRSLRRTGLYPTEVLNSQGKTINTEYGKWFTWLVTSRVFSFSSVSWAAGVSLQDLLSDVSSHSLVDLLSHDFFVDVLITSFSSD